MGLEGVAATGMMAMAATSPIEYVLDVAVRVVTMVKACGTPCNLPAKHLRC